jgi:dienelactone hydrolase
MISQESVQIRLGEISLDGDLVLPETAAALVVFAHGSGSSRHSPRNRFVARALNQRGLGTLLMDLLTADEEAEDRFTAALRFDIELLADRLVGTVDWSRARDGLKMLRLGFFGASTGAAAALVAAAQRPDDVGAVVSRGGRPDLAGEVLAKVRAPTLLIVGGNDEVVLELNERARRQLTAAAATELTIIPGASHLFEEPGALEQVAEHAGRWFERYLKSARARPQTR